MRLCLNSIVVQCVKVFDMPKLDYISTVLLTNWKPSDAATGSGTSASFGKQKKPSQFPGFELDKCSISIEACRIDNAAYLVFLRGALPNLKHWKEILEKSVRNDSRVTDPKAIKKLPTRQHIKNVIAEKSKPGSVWSKPTPFDTRWRYQVRRYYEIEIKEWEFGGMRLKENRLRYRGNLITPIEISYNLILAAHVENGTHVGRDRTYDRLNEVTHSIKKNMVGDFIMGCPCEFISCY